MMVSMKINGKTVKARKGETVLAVARREGFDIPSLCFHEAFEEGYGACRLCIVEVVKGPKTGIITSCTLKADDGLEIETNTPEIESYRKILLELFLAQAPRSKEIAKLAEKYGVKRTRFPKKLIPNDPLGNKCVLCGLCIRVCNEIMNIGAIDYIGRGSSTEINTPFFEENPDCIGCSACAHVCPTQAISLEDVNATRLMKSWSNTKIELKKCKICGRPFAPKPLFEKTASLIDLPLTDELEDLCPSCREKLSAKKITAFLQVP